MDSYSIWILCESVVRKPRVNFTLARARAQLRARARAPARARARARAQLQAHLIS